MMSLVKMFLSLGIAASLTAGLSGCESAGKKTAAGVGIGAAAGAILGAAVGGKDKAKGAAIGAALGAGVGGVIGNRMDKQAKELEKVAETKRTEQGIVTKLKSDILFDTGKSNLKPGAITSIGELSKIIKQYPENVLTVKGYTDNVGTQAINQKLSEERANAVKTQLVAGGIPVQTVNIVGMGDAQPVGDNKTNVGRSQNRRVEIEITADASKVPADAK
jgi:outer membrane protein OmpA-like peptidoglycan-associated protein